MSSHQLFFRQENDRLHIELDRVSRDQMVYASERTRGRSPEPAFAARSAVEIAELQDKLEKTQNELRRAQAELRLNQSDYDRSHVELEQMQEKVCNVTSTPVRVGSFLYD